MKFVLLLGLVAFVSANPVNDKRPLQYFKKEDLGEAFQRFELPESAGCDAEVQTCIAETHTLAHRCIGMMSKDIGQQMAACKDREDIAAADKTWQEASFKWHDGLEKCLNGAPLPAAASRKRRNGTPVDDDEDRAPEQEQEQQPNEADNENNDERSDDDKKRKKRNSDDDHDCDDGEEPQPPSEEEQPEEETKKRRRHAQGDDDHHENDGHDHDNEEETKKRRRHAGEDHEHDENDGHDQDNEEENPPAPRDSADNEDSLKLKRRRRDHHGDHSANAAEGSEYADHEACWRDMRQKNEACKTKANGCTKYAKCNGLGSEPTDTTEAAWWNYMKGLREDKETKVRAHKRAIHACLHPGHTGDQQGGLWHQDNE